MRRRISRKNIFRGKITVTDWTEGYLLADGSGTYIYDGYEARFVCKDTVCQYTGMNDRNRVKIFEEDILEARLDDERPENVTRVVVKWISLKWYLYQTDGTLLKEMDESDINLWTVVGNVFDNPDLLKG